MNNTDARIRIGISGWRYAPWRGVFYPPDLIQKYELHYASQRFAAIEINGSFYALQRPESYESWYQQTPQDFRFTVKAPRYITHIKRLRDIDTAVANFFASGIFNLREKLGPLLWQFPPSFKFDAELVENFLALLPHDTAAAAKLAKHHDAFMHNRVQLSVDKKRPLRHAMEVRNGSFLDENFVKLLRRYEVALVVADTAGHWPLREDITADFVYVRLHGEKRLYAGGYSAASLTRWAKRIAAWQRGTQPRDAHLIVNKAPAPKEREVYCFFDNTDIKLRAPFDAATLAEKLHLPERAPVEKYDAIRKTAKRATQK